MGGLRLSQATAVTADVLFNFELQMNNPLLSNRDRKAFFGSKQHRKSTFS